MAIIISTQAVMLNLAEIDPSKNVSSGLYNDFKFFSPEQPWRFLASKKKFNHNIGSFFHTLEHNVCWKTMLTGWIITFVFMKIANFFAENWSNSPKIVIICNIDPRLSPAWKWA
jgi:hypothetical protein